MKTVNTQVLIIGGGPAGSALGSYLAKANIKSVIIEKELFPREHVGESLVITCNRIFHELELDQELEDAKFPKKYGAAWTNTSKQSVFSHDWEDYNLSESVSINFNDRKQEGLNTEYTYHVDRGLFDKMLLDKSRRLGVEVWEETFVQDVKITPENVQCKAKYKQEDIEFIADIIVDASGRNTFLGRLFDLKINDPDFNQLAIHTWYKNFDRSVDPKKDFIYIHFLPYSHTWLWQIPITEDITSIGLVTHKDHVKKSGKTNEELFYEFIATNPSLAERINKAERIKSFKMEADYSYKMTEVTGDRFALVGDAARYVDPIFSSGVSIALNGARILSADIIEAVKKNQYTKEVFHHYDSLIKAGCKNWYDFILLYYKLNVMFTWFVANPKYKNEVLRFLQGDVYDTEESFLIKDMRKLAEDVENNENHVLNKYINKNYQVIF